MSWPCFSLSVNHNVGLRKDGVHRPQALESVPVIVNQEGSQVSAEHGVLALEANYVVVMVVEPMYVQMSVRDHRRHHQAQEYLHGVPRAAPGSVAL